MCGHLKFDSQLLYDVKRGNSSVLTCKDCAKTAATYKCDACTEEEGRAIRRTRVWQCRKHNRIRVCLACQQRGFSTKDCEEYMCKGCEKGWGHSHFEKNRLRHAKDGKSALCCPECVERKKVLLAKLKATSSWRCSCKPIPRYERAHAALHWKMHTPRCVLTPTRMNEERWDGKNVGIEKDDLEFLARTKSY